MKIFTSYSYAWWQIGIFKLALLSIGIIIGAHWNGFFGSYLPVLGVIAVISAVYIISVSIRKIK